MAENCVKLGRDVLGTDRSCGEQPGQQVATEYLLGAVDVFGRVDGIAQSYALSPPFALRRHRSYKQRIPLHLRTEGSPERRH
jgi:hypothetical protein